MLDWPMKDGLPRPNTLRNQSPPSLLSSVVILSLIERKPNRLPVNRAHHKRREAPLKQMILGKRLQKQDPIQAIIGHPKLGCLALSNDNFAIYRHTTPAQHLASSSGLITKEVHLVKWPIDHRAKSILHLPHRYVCMNRVVAGYLRSVLRAHTMYVTLADGWAANR